MLVTGSVFSRLGSEASQGPRRLLGTGMTARHAELSYVLGNICVCPRIHMCVCPRPSLSTFASNTDPGTQEVSEPDCG